MVDDRQDRITVNLEGHVPGMYLEWEGELCLPEEQRGFTGHSHPLQLLAVHDGADEVGHLQTIHTAGLGPPSG